MCQYVQLCPHVASGCDKLREAEQYLSQAQWAVMKAENCSAKLKSQLHRNLGLLAFTRGQYTEARKQLAEDVCTYIWRSCHCSFKLDPYFVSDIPVQCSSWCQCSADCRRALPHGQCVHEGRQANHCTVFHGSGTIMRETMNI